MSSGQIEPGAPPPRRSHKSLIVRLLLLSVAMFGFGFALVPIYDWVCDVTGLNGRTGRIAESAAASGDWKNRAAHSLVKVTFDATGGGGPWEFYPLTPSLEMETGVLHDVYYRFRNVSNEPIRVRAIPSVSPASMARRVNKAVCFCFNEQAFSPGEERDLLVRLMIDPGVPPGNHEAVLSYSIFQL